MNNLKNYLFTSESVSEGHPDKVCDRISDMVVDHYLSQDPYSRVACETLTTTNKVVLAGEVRGPELNKDNLIEKVKGCIKDIGYDQKGFSWKNVNIDCFLHSQSTDIAMGVDSTGNKDEGAGDQGIMFGYACDETEELMPAPIQFSHKILRLMAKDRKSGVLKEQVFEEDPVLEDGEPNNEIIIVAKRKWQIPYWDLISELGIDVDDVRNKNKELDARVDGPLENRSKMDDINVDKVAEGIVTI